MKKIIILSSVIIFITILRKSFVGDTIYCAVKEPRYQDFIVVTETRTTDYNWEMVNPQNHNFIEYINIENDAELKDFDYEFFLGHNYYYLYGNFVDDLEKGKTFIYRDWDFVYPIKHGFFSTFLLSPKYVYEIER